MKWQSKNWKNSLTNLTQRILPSCKIYHFFISEFAATSGLDSVAKKGCDLIDCSSHSPFTRNSLKFTIKPSLLLSQPKIGYELFHGILFLVNSLFQHSRLSILVSVCLFLTLFNCVHRFTDLVRLLLACSSQEIFITTLHKV